MTPDETATTVNKALREGDEEWAFRMILQARDDLRAATASALREALEAAWTRRARQIEDQRFDTLFRAIIAHEFGSDAPEWTRDARLDDEWVMDDPFRDPDAGKRRRGWPPPGSTSLSEDWSPREPGRCLRAHLHRRMRGHRAARGLGRPAHR
jgi:hypothetical protein